MYEKHKEDLLSLADRPQPAVSKQMGTYPAAGEPGRAYLHWHRLHTRLDPVPAEADNAVRHLFHMLHPGHVVVFSVAQ